MCKYLSREASDGEHPNSFFKRDVTGCSHAVISYKHWNYTFSLNRQHIHSRGALSEREAFEPIKERLRKVDVQRPHPAP